MNIVPINTNNVSRPVAPEIALTARPRAFNFVEELDLLTGGDTAFDRAARGELDDEYIRSLVQVAE